MYVRQVSVLLPLYRGELFFQECFSSILDQLVDFRVEILIILNGCSESTIMLVEHIVKQHTMDLDTKYSCFEIHVLKLDHNNLIDALEAGLQVSQSNLVARIDVDDVIICPHRLKRQFDYLQENAQINVVGSQAVIEQCGKSHQHDQESPSSYLRLASGIPTHPALVQWHMLFRCPVLHPSVMFRRNIVAEVGGYRSLPLESDGLQDDVEDNNDDDVVEDYRLWHKVLERCGDSYCATLSTHLSFFCSISSHVTNSIFFLL